MTLEAERAVPAQDAVRGRRLPRPDRRELAAGVLILTSVALWVVGWMGADPRAMTDYGTVSLLTPASVLALVLLTVSFVAALRLGVQERVLAGHGVALALMIYSVPIAVFGTLRYPWAWKHVGIVEYIVRTGSVDRGIDNLAVYHNWPGFFAGAGWLQELLGAPDAVGLATWASLAFTLANLVALRFVLRALTADDRRIWVTIWLFLVVNWVGQSYFAPQAFAYFLYLVVIGLVLRACRRASPPESVAAAPLPARVVLPIVVVVLLAAIAFSHQLTPLMTVIMLAVLWLSRSVRGWYLPLIAAVLTAGWALTVARGYTVPRLADLLVSPLTTVGENLDKSEFVRGAAVVVSTAGRLVVVIVVLLAVAGIVRTWRRRLLDRVATALAAAPGLLLFVAAFGGEMLFRIVLFSSPFLLYLGTLAVFPDAAAPRTRSSLGQAAAVGALTAVLTPLFLLAYYGKDAGNYFTPDEIRVTTALYANAPPGSLLVEGNTNYPHNPRNYENFTYVPIASEPAPDRQEILADPVGVLGEWLADERHTGAYVIITRGQKIANDTTGPMPPGSLQAVEDALRASPRFVPVYDHPDAVVFGLAEQHASGGSR